MALRADPAALRRAVPEAGRAMLWALAASVGLHAGLGALALLRPGPRVPDEMPPIEVELVQQEAMQKGVPQPQTPAAPPPRPPAPEAKEARVPAPPPTPAAPPRPATQPAVHLGDGPDDSDPLTVTGEHVVPPAPDALYRNRPPVYPADAARAGAEGTVQLLVRVSARGVPDAVIVAVSSGHPSLDAAARQAVLLWRFRPARVRGEPAPFDYVMNVRFKLGDRE